MSKIMAEKRTLAEQARESLISEGWNQEYEDFDSEVKRRADFAAQVLRRACEIARGHHCGTSNRSCDFCSSAEDIADAIETEFPEARGEERRRT